MIEAALAAGAPIEAVELRLPSPRPGSRGPDRRSGRRSRPLKVEIYLELVPGESWRDSVPAAIGAASAVGARVKLRCGGESADAVPARRAAWRS